MTPSTAYEAHRPHPWWSRCGLAILQGLSSGVARTLSARWWDYLSPA